MAYLTEEDLIARVGGADRYAELTDDDHDGAPDEGVAAQLLAGVDEEANGYLRLRYDVPLAASLLPSIKNALLDIAEYRAKSRGDRVPSDTVRRHYEDAISLLVNVSTGKFLLEVVESVSRLGEYLIDSDDQELSRDSLRVW